MLCAFINLIIFEATLQFTNFQLAQIFVYHVFNQLPQLWSFFKQ